MKRKKNNIKIDNLGLKKLRVFMSIGFILLILLVFRIGFIQFVQGSELKEMAVSYQLTNKTIVPSRGSIYDSTGKALAISAKVDTVSVNPSDVKYSNKEEVNKEILAHEFSNIFDLNYEEILQKLTTKDSTFVVASKVESDKITELKNWIKENEINSGISITEDTNRY